MYELIKVSESCHYINSPAKIGVVNISDDEVVFIDSGSDKDAGRKARQILDEKGWKLRAVYNTHSNADHIGGNKYLQSQTGCKIYAKGIEKDFTLHPILESAFLYGGYPMKELRHKFLLAQESEVCELSADVLPRGFEMIELKGHFFDMVGFRAPDDTVFLADCLSSEKTLEKYGIGFIYDIAAYLETLEKVSKMQAKVFVPSHAEVSGDIAPLARLNAEKVYEIAGKIEKICEYPHSFEEILKELFCEYSLIMNHEQYVLVGSTVRSYLSYLSDTGRIASSFEDNRMLWKKI